MPTAPELFGYIGPADLLRLVRPDMVGARIAEAADFEAWVWTRGAAELAEPSTYVVDAGGCLRLAPRRSEHVVCAGGAAVRAAGEIGFRGGPDGWAVAEVSNQSTGYCPDLSSWPAVAAALDRAGLDRPDGFTHEVVFRRCPGCREINLVRDGHFVCVFCDADLPGDWNLGDTTGFRAGVDLRNI
jgi:hypothetical protein